MWEIILRTVLKTSMIAAIAAVIVMLLRIPLKKAPHRWSYLLWAVVFFRCLCPVSFESGISIFNAIPDEQPAFSQTADVVYIDSTEIYKDYSANADNYSAENTEIPEEKSTGKILVIIWLTGTAAMLSYGIVSYIILKSRLKTAVKISGNIYETDGSSSAFSAGLFPAKIYIPAGYSEEQQRFMIVHERTHIKRLDHISKTIAFIGLSIHWFDPFIWASFILMTKDMELSCDEAVLRQLGAEEKTAYSRTLLQASMKRSGIISLPTAFAEKSIKERVKNALSYKKPKVFVTVIAVIAVITAFTVLGTNAVKKPDNDGDNEILLTNYLTPINTGEEQVYIINEKSADIAGIDVCGIIKDEVFLLKYAVSEKIDITFDVLPSDIYKVYIDDLKIIKNSSGEKLLEVSMIVYTESEETTDKVPVTINEEIDTGMVGGNNSQFDVWAQIKPSYQENFNAVGLVLCGLENAEVYINGNIDASESGTDNYSEDNVIFDPYTAVLDPDLKYLESDLQANTFYLLNEIPGTDIRLYGSYGNGMQVIIEHDGIRDLFDQVWSPLPFKADILAAYGDYDGDGKKEISAVYNTGHGTGVSVWQFVIYKMNDDGHFEDIRTDADAIGEAFRNAVDISVDNGTKNISYTVGGKTRTSSYADNFADEYYGGNVTSKDIRFTDQVHFTLDGDKIFCSVVPGLITTYYGDELTGKVKFDGKNFSIENIGFA